MLQRLEEIGQEGIWQDVLRRAFVFSVDWHKALHSDGGSGPKTLCLTPRSFDECPRQPATRDEHDVCRALAPHDKAHRDIGRLDRIAAITAAWMRPVVIEPDWSTHKIAVQGRKRRLRAMKASRSATRTWRSESQSARFWRIVPVKSKFAAERIRERR